MAFERHSLLSNGTVAEGAISISLNDSWAGRKLLEALDISPNRFSPEHMEMRYQQKQQVERDQRKTELSTNVRSLAALDANDNKLLTASLGAGKVRQMFDERRHRTTGIDKSYPLQPITSNTRKSPAAVRTSTISTTTTSSRSSNKGGSTTVQNSSRVDALKMFKNNSFSNNNNNDIGSTNGNISIASFLDNEEFPDETLPDDDIDYPDSRSANRSIGRTTTMPVRLPTVSKQLSNLSLNGRDPAKQRSSLGGTNRPAVPAPVRKLVPMKPAPLPKALAQTSPAVAVNNRSGSGGESVRSVPRSVRTSPSANTSPPSSAKASAGRSTSEMAATPKRPPAGPVPDNMSTCGTCGRNFNTDRLEKHETICKKTAAKKRKIFDATSHRIMGTDAESFVKKQLRSQHIAIPKRGPIVTASVVAKITANSSPPKKNDWRRKHEEFIAAIRSAKQVQVHLAKGGKLSDLPPPPPSENPDYVPCPHCGRRFNSTAAERHIPKCATFQHNKPKPKGAPSRKY